MSEEEIYKMLNNFPQIEIVKYILKLQEQPTGHLFTDTNWEDLLEYNNKTWIGLDRFKQLQQENQQLKKQLQQIKIVIGKIGTV